MFRKHDVFAKDLEILIHLSSSYKLGITNKNTLLYFWFAVITVQHLITIHLNNTKKIM